MSLLVNASLSTNSQQLAVLSGAAAQPVDPATKRFEGCRVYVGSEGKPILIECKGQQLDYSPWTEAFYGKPEVLDSKELEMHWTTQAGKPGKYHPWR